MEELFNLTYKAQVEALKEEEEFEKLGDAKYLHHEDTEARLYWAFCRPSGSHPEQLKDPEPLVSIMAFNHSRLGALERFSLLHPKVIQDPELRQKIRNRSRMLFRDLVDNDFTELNRVLDRVPQFLPLAIDQLKNGRKWNEIAADDVEASRFIETVGELADESFFKALYEKLTPVEELDADALKTHLQKLLKRKGQLHPKLSEFYREKTLHWLKNSSLHPLQKKSLQQLLKSL